jgi:DNA helicase-2/ATP-dependent DNA helicase PcrA
MAERAPLPELLETVLDESGYSEMWQRDKSIEAPGRLDNLRELVRTLEEYENLGAFLDHVSLVMENENAGDTDMVSIMTLHAAKGLEFDVIFLPGWEETLFPNQRSLDESGTAALEEERRLAHVGLTRARKSARISCAMSRRTFSDWQNNVPSRFIDELPPEHVEVVAGTTGVNSFAEQASGFDNVAAGGNAYWDSPGRRRMRRNRSFNRDGVVLDAKAETAWSEVPEGKFGRGDRVFHEKFGYGRIEAVEGNRLHILFEKAGAKKVIDSFVRPA